jgi:hypothetical protein
MKPKEDYSVGWFIQAGLQILAIALCALVLINMSIEDAQPPKPSCVDYGTK